MKRKGIILFILLLLILLSVVAFHYSTVVLKSDVRDAKPEDGSFQVLFLDVGQADSALVMCDGHSMLIDGGNVGDSSLVYTTLKKLGIDHLDYIICTHPDEDHVGGLSGALNYATVDTAFCSVQEYDSKAFASFVKYLDAQNKEITVPQAGFEFSLGSASAQIVGPIKLSSDSNDNSLVIRTAYGDTSFLFTGDAGREEEQDILDAGYSLESTVLKVGHHGSSSSSTYPFLRAIKPEIAVISVGQDNPYGLPSGDVLSRLRDVDATVFRTDMQGWIYCVSDGKTISVATEKNADMDTLIGGPYIEPKAIQTPALSNVPNVSEETDYILNKSSKKFHYPWCSGASQIKDKNKQYYTGSRNDIIEMGYTPCKICNP